MTYPDDLHPITIKKGSRWYAQYRTPWGLRTVFDEGTKPKLFDDEFTAFKAATKAMTVEFRNKCSGWQSEPLNSAHEAAEALFRK